ncbi:MAG: RNA polymerase sigma factor, partial [Planctomycetaceae bacterium]
MQDTELITLVQHAQGGDREAFGSLISEFEPMVYGVIMRRLRNTAEASEVTQDVFVRALRKLDQLREPERFIGWLKRIAVRLAINRA